MPGKSHVPERASNAGQIAGLSGGVFAWRSWMFAQYSEHPHTMGLSGLSAPLQVG